MFWAVIREMQLGQYILSYLGGFKLTAISTPKKISYVIGLWRIFSKLIVFRGLWHNWLWQWLKEGCRKLMFGGCPAWSPYNFCGMGVGIHTYRFWPCCTPPWSWTILQRVRQAKTYCWHWAICVWFQTYCYFNTKENWLCHRSLENFQQTDSFWRLMA